MHLTGGLERRFPTLLITGRVAKGEADLLPRAEGRGVRISVIPELGREIRPLRDLRALLKLIRLFRRERPEIVHTHTAKAGTVGRLAAVLAGVPVRVHTYHGHVFKGYFGPVKTRLFLAIERFLARFTTRIIAISPAQAEDLVEQFRICERGRVRIIPLGLELDRFQPDRIQRLRPGFREEIGAGEQSVVAIVGRLVPIKRHDLFLEAAARLQRAGRRCVFVVVGGGPEEPRLRRLSAELGISSTVCFLGWRQDLERIYAGADVVALTSDNEGTPVCLIEALAAGRPVAATDVGGVRDVLRGGELGLLVPSGDADAFAAALARLLDEPGLREELGREGAAVAPRMYGLNRLLDDTAALYDQLLLNSRAADWTLSTAEIHG